MSEQKQVIYNDKPLGQAVYEAYGRSLIFGDAPEADTLPKWSELTEAQRTAWSDATHQFWYLARSIYEPGGEKAEGYSMGEFSFGVDPHQEKFNKWLS